MLRCDLVRRGLGPGLLPEALVAPDLEVGELVALFPDEVGAEGVVALVYAQRALLAPKTRAFIDHAAAWFDAQSPQGPWRLGRPT